MKILHVDDEPLVTKATRRILERLGHEVTTSTAPVAPVGYDVAILDWDPHGPAMVDYCARYLVPYVIYSGDLSDIPESMIRVAKPARIGELIDAIDRAVSEHAISTGGISI